MARISIRTVEVGKTVKESRIQESCKHFPEQFSSDHPAGDIMLAGIAAESTSPLSTSAQGFIYSPGQLPSCGSYKAGLLITEVLIIKETITIMADQCSSHGDQTTF